MKVSTSGVVVVVLATAAATAVLRAQTNPDPMLFRQSMTAGEMAARERQFDMALGAFKQANEMTGKKSPDAFFAMSRVHHAMTQYDEALKDCDNALKFVGTNVRFEAVIRNQRGLSLIASAGKATDQRLKDAEAEFRKILDITDVLPIARYYLGVVLLKQNRDPEGLAELKSYVAAASATAEANEARRILEDPRRAREPFAPDFTVPVLAGGNVALKDLLGKVVVLDFWGSWCPPCRESTPTLIETRNKFAQQPVEFIGIADYDREADWKAYLANHQLNWPQHRDDGSIQRLYQVTAFPTFIVIDPSGIMRAHRLGFSTDLGDWLKSEINKALKAPKTES